MAIFLEGFRFGGVNFNNSIFLVADISERLQFSSGLALEFGMGHLFYYLYFVMHPIIFAHAIVFVHIHCALDPTIIYIY